MDRIDSSVNESPTPPPKRIRATMEEPKFCIGDTLTDTMEMLLKPAQNDAYIDEKAMKMMEKMGYKKGCGLGKSNQGRLDPVLSSNQRGRRGLGLESLPFTDLIWDPSTEVMQVKEDIKWIPSKTEPLLTADLLKSWTVQGKRKLQIDDETEYCNSGLLRNVLEAKQLLDQLESVELCKARSRANPFETIKGVFFLNRAAVKMANVDAACNFMFTNVEKTLTTNCKNKPCYFADVCAGPGGFSEYILWRKKWFYKGFGFTLRGENDFKLNDFFAAPTESFQALYGAQNDGNVYDPSNITDFTEKVLMQTDGLGVHFMMADGGFSVEGHENLQEILSKQIYLCQCLVALAIVRTGGHFVTKLFDLFTPFSVGLVYLMYRCFENVSILKPNASRPANSERYLICKCKKADTSVVLHFLKDINIQLWNFEEGSEMDVISLVPSEVISNDATFYEYILDSNNRLCERQIVSLLKIIAFSKDLKLVEPKQTELRTECLAYWNIPNKPRAAPLRMTVNELITTLLSDADFMYTNAVDILTEQDLRNTIKINGHTYFCILNDNKSRPLYKFYLACGGSQVYKLKSNVWTLTTMNIELPRGSLIIAEEVMEFQTQITKKLKSIPSLHIIDACFLGDVNLMGMHYSERLDYIQIYCAAVNRPFRTDMVRIRAKPVFGLEQFIKIECPFKISLKNGNDKYAYHLPDICNEQAYFLPGYILFLDGTPGECFNETYPRRINCQLSEFQNITLDTNQVTWKSLYGYLNEQITT